MVIVGLNHDDKADGSGKAPITLGMKNLMATKKQMSEERRNVGPFVATDMYLWLQMEIFPNLPIELQNLITPVTKKTTAGSNSSNIRTDSMKLWLFSLMEANQTMPSLGEGTPYEYYRQNTSLVKRLSNGAGSANYWWLRSPSTDGITLFWGVYSDGSVDSDPADISHGVCFGFAIDAPSKSYPVGNKDGGATHPPSGKQFETVPYQIDGSSRGVVKTISGTPVEVEYLADRSNKSVEIIKKMPNTGVNIAVGVAP